MQNEKSAAKSIGQHFSLTGCVASINALPFDATGDTGRGLILALLTAAVTSRGAGSFACGEGGFALLRAILDISSAVCGQAVAHTRFSCVKAGCHASSA